MFLPTHIAFAILLSVYFKLPVLPAILGAILPDIDSPRTTIGKLLSPISFPLGEKFGHRTIMHSWIPITIIGIYALTVRDSSAWSLLLGYSSHILLDMLTRNGVAFLFPEKLYIVLTDFQIETGGRIDRALSVFFLILSLILFFQHEIIQYIQI